MSPEFVLVDGVEPDAAPEELGEGDVRAELVPAAPVDPEPVLLDRPLTALAPVLVERPVLPPTALSLGNGAAGASVVPLGLSGPASDVNLPEDRRDTCADAIASMNRRGPCAISPHANTSGALV